MFNWSQLHVYSTAATKPCIMVAIVHLQCGFMAYHYTTVVLVQGIGQIHAEKTYCYCERMSHTLPNAFLLLLYYASEHYLQIQEDNYVYDAS